MRKGEVADEARLLYVAMRRAIEMLVLTGDGAARWKRSQVCVCSAAEGGAGEGGVGEPAQRGSLLMLSHQLF